MSDNILYDSEVLNITIFKNKHNYLAATVQQILTTEQNVLS